MRAVKYMRQHNPYPRPRMCYMAVVAQAHALDACVLDQEIEALHKEGLLSESPATKQRKHEEDAFDRKKSEIDAAAKANRTEVEENASAAKKRVNEWLEAEIAKLNDAHAGAAGDEL